MKEEAYMRLKACLLLVPIFLCTVNVLAAVKASISAKSDDGAYIALDDGTKWLVSSGDQATVSLWLVGDDVVYIDNSKSCSGTEIINTDEDGEEACVKPLPN